MATIQAKVEYKAPNTYCTREKFEDAQRDARKGVFRKYIDTSFHRPSYWTSETRVGWFGGKTTHSGDYVPGVQRSADEAVDDVMKFYDQIMSELKAIDEQTPPEPVKH